jgi:hypothetical protein
LHVIQGYAALSEKSGNAVNRSFNAVARGQFLQACPEILVGCADYLIASEVAYDCFLLAPPE